MKKIIIFEHEPDYVFGTDELDTVLAWPEHELGAFHTREFMESGEIAEKRIYGYEMPKSGEEYEEIMESISSGDYYAIEAV